jgi:hypothetical protein
LQEAWVVERFGKFHAVLDPGLSLLIPLIDEIKYVHTLKEVVIEIPSQAAITQDNVTMQLDGVLYVKVRCEPVHTVCFVSHAGPPTYIPARTPTRLPAASRRSHLHARTVCSDVVRTATCTRVIACGVYNRASSSSLHHAFCVALRCVRCARARQVDDPYMASYGVEDPEYAVAQLAQTTMRSELGQLKLDEVFKERQALNELIVAAINKVREETNHSALARSLMHSIATVENGQ